MLRSVAVVSILATLTGSTAFGVDTSDRPAATAVVTVAAPSSSELVTTTTAAAIPPVTSDSISTSTTSTTSTTSATSTTMAELTSANVPVPRTPETTEIEFGGVVSFSFGAGASFDAPPGREDCIRTAKTSPLKLDGNYDQNRIAQMTHAVFECLSAVAGLDEVSPTSLRRWNGATVWGFGSLSEQVAAEAVVVAYCESSGFSPRALTSANAFGYAGLFQMGRTEMSRFGDPGSSRFDPVDNAVAAANYFLFQYRNRNGWGGWSPWAVVNTNFDDEVNNQVKVPVLPRFISTDPDFRGRPGPELPAWAVDPWSWEVPHWSGTGCPYNGWRWPAASPLDP